MIYTDITDIELKKHLQSIASDGMDVFTLADHQVRGAVLNATNLVNAMRANHQLGILETLALGYGYMAGLLCTMQLKGRDKVVLSMKTDGPMQGMTVEADGQGRVRGYMNEHVFPITEPVESFDLAPYIGKGSLSLSRLYEGAKEPVTGSTILRHGDIARDLALHFKESEQTHTAFSLGLWYDKQGRVMGAGAIFLQALPGADETLLLDLDDWLPELPSLSKGLAGGITPTAWLHAHFKAFEPQLMGTKRAEFTCSCSREGFHQYLLSLDTEKRLDLCNSGPMPMEVLCHNCGSKYHYTQADLGV